MRETLLEVGTLYFNLDTNPLFENDLYRSDLLLLMYVGRMEALLDCQRQWFK